MIGPKTWDRIVGIFLGFSLVAVTAQKIRGCLGLLIPDFYFKSCICMENAGNGEWAVDRSQNMGPNYGNIF